MIYKHQKYIKRVISKTLHVVTVLLLFAGCSDETEDLSLGQLPSADFQAVVAEGSNTVQLINTTSTPTIAYWTVENTGQTFRGDTATIRLTFEGTYDVTLLVAGKGGTSTITKQVTIAQNDPTACSPDRPLGFIAGCTEKVWRLNPEAGAFKVGEGPDNGNWWSSGAGDVQARACEFNDEFTFRFDAQGTFAYDNKGDLFADGYLGTGSTACEPASNLTGDQAAWDSGTFSFSVIEGAGINGLGQLRLNGRGAHIGVKKAHNGGETPGGPVGNSVTYDILAMEQNVNGEGYDILKIGVNIGGPGWWTFTLRSY
ncbi:PKD domain-containing protein [Parapedobacter sp. ISTM3]|uniref:PKD domain-containing protein n=1 Tax=Parapedobacter sp. ISTM3 TaxID=2800130 RepID=UPI001905E461|nr:PKD domain-containing protein [Parapedobacter sp. ISTM3]MBK1438622.1 PKD domain-containing protein [Parapedobacter sp. ISTM3]